MNTIGKPFKLGIKNDWSELHVCFRYSQIQVNGKFGDGQNLIPDDCAINCFSALCSPHHPDHPNHPRLYVILKYTTTPSNKAGDNTPGDL